MTRDEAIERLNIHKSTSVFVDSIAEAIDMAIEALHREEAEAKGYCHRIKPKEDFKEMDEQTVIDHDRDWIIGCIEHDGFILVATRLVLWHQPAYAILVLKKNLQRHFIANGSYHDVIAFRTSLHFQLGIIPVVYLPVYH